MATRCFSFEVTARDAARDTSARTGRLTTAHGNVDTPAFMPVGTYGAVKGIAPWELRDLGAQIVLSNAFHLEMRPGSEAVEQLGGLHRFMGWDGPILTDSGGFQVFSLETRRTVDEGGVGFLSPVDGSHRRFTPESVVGIQQRLGVDVAMPLDVCVAWGAPDGETREGMERTLRWAHRSLEARDDAPMALFGIVQGGFDTDLRRRCIDELAALPFDGLALGGLSVGEPKEELLRMVRDHAPLLPLERPRYLMGVGYPDDLVEAVAAGIDMFDCVLPTRNARNGYLFVEDGRIAIKNARHRLDEGPIEEGCGCPACAAGFSRAYLRHSFQCGEMLASRLMTLHNLHHYQQRMREMREAIAGGTFTDLLRDVQQRRQQKASDDAGKGRLP